MWKSVVVFIAALSLISCTSMQVMERSDAGDISEKISVGDEVMVTTLSGERYELKITSAGHASLTGKDREGKNWRVPYAQIAQMEIKEVSTLKTGGLIAVLLYGLGVLAIVAAGRALSSGFD